MKVIFNHQVLEESKVPSLNRGLMFGDGLFETIIFKGNKPKFFPLHLARLQRGSRMLGFEFPEFEEQTIREWANQLLEIDEQNYRAKWLVWRKGSGTYSPEFSMIDFLFLIKPSDKTGYSFIDRAAICSSVRLAVSPFSFCKTISSLPYVLASKEKNELNLEEIVLLNQFGALAECSSSNLFWLKENTLYTPSLDSGCVDGVMRQVIIKHCLEKGIYLNQGNFDPEHLDNADLIFSTNVAHLKIFKFWNSRALELSHDLLKQILPYWQL